MGIRFARYSFLLGFLLVICGKAWAQLPPDFVDLVSTTGWEQATGFTFDENGRQYVWEKSGLVYLVEEEERLPNPLIDIREEVGDWRDHGLMCVALHPNFIQNGYFYLLYVVDQHHLLHYGSPDYSADSSSSFVASIGRITRYKADAATDFTTVVAGSRKILLGESISTGIPLLLSSHGVGTLLFGTDGSLLVSVGDGASHRELDAGGDKSYAPEAIQLGILREKEDVGAYRSQMLDSHNGKILRLDPETGSGIASNPFFDASAPRSARSRVWALGFRNPFRMCLQPGTGSHNMEDGDPGVLYVGDNGWFSWEEINVLEKGGGNYGWPLFEGMEKGIGYYDKDMQHPEAPNPLSGANGCWRPNFQFKNLILEATESPNPFWPNPCDSNQGIGGNVPTFIHQRPELTWANNLNPPPRVKVPTFNSEGEPQATDISSSDSPVKGNTFNGASAIGGNFYTGTAFPEEYQGAYLFGDYAKHWIRKWDVDSTGSLVEISPFQLTAGNFVHMATHPVDGCLYYLPYEEAIRKVCFGGNQPPKVIAGADTFYGPSPLTVNFQGSQSFDPQGEPIRFHWDFGDGDTSSLADPRHTYIVSGSVPTAFSVWLTVSDSSGIEVNEELTISVNNTPPKVRISSFKDGDFYATSGPTLLSLEAEVSDAEHNNAELAYTWQTFLHHNTHYHPEPPDHKAVSQTLITPIGCDNEIYFYRISLEVADPAGLSTKEESQLYPYCGPEIAVFDTFSVGLKEESVDLHWTMLSEAEVAIYLVERAGSGIPFTPIAEIGPDMGSYSFQDAQPLQGNNHYRIRANAGNGLFEFSQTLSVPFPPPHGVQVFPNPTWNDVKIEFEYLRGSAYLQIFNLMGQLVHEEFLEGTGPFVHQIDVRKFGAGLYSYRIDHSGYELLTGKFIIYSP